MKEWFTPSEIAAAALPDLPTTQRGINKIASSRAWQERRNRAGEPLARRRKGRGGGWEYHYSLFPTRAQQALVARAAAEKRAAREAGQAAPEAKGASELWAWFDRLPESRKEKARRRLDALEAVQALRRGAIPVNLAVHDVARRFGVGASTLYSWMNLVEGIDRKDWLPHLAPRHTGRTATSYCDPRAWEALKADYLRLEKPPFTTCYERLQLMAAEHGWQIPSARTLERRLEAEIPAAVRVYLREGAEALRRMYPAQERDRTMFHALEAVNVDGHKWDVFVRWPDGTVARPIMVAIQDLYSNKILSWRVDRSENSDLVRLAFADVFRTYGIPDRAWMDNGRGFAAKCITGGTPNRYRFKVKAEEPSGILTTLGVEVHWTSPYSGQSKPIERAFRDLCDAIAKHPAFAGAYTGNRPDAKPENYGSKAVDLDAFLTIVEQGIRLHNARPKRNTKVCQRVKSFEQAFAESYAQAPIRRATEEQLRMCLLAAESVRTDRSSGAVRLLGNRFWGECLHDHRGQAVTVRFDPDNLQDGVHVYRLDGGYIGWAECLEAAGFADTAAAREHARKRKAFQKAAKTAAALERQLSTEELLRLLPEVEEAEPPRSRVTRLVTVGSLAAKPANETGPEIEDTTEDFFASLGRGLRLVKAEEE